MEPNWKEIASGKKCQQQESIPNDWLISPPPVEQLDVTQVPGSCGLLARKELEITETVDVADLLRKLSAGEWSSVEVTTAFYKRAIVAQQLVRYSLYARSCASKC